MAHLSFQTSVIILTVFESSTVSPSCIYIFIHLGLTLVVKPYSQDTSLSLALFIREVENSPSTYKYRIYLVISS